MCLTFYPSSILKVRTDRSLSFYEGDDNPNVNLLRDILLTYSFYNFDLGYCQVIVLTYCCLVKQPVFECLKALFGSYFVVAVILCVLTPEG